MKENCPYYRTGSGPLKAGSKICRQFQQDERRGNCPRCNFYQPPEPVTPEPAPKEEVMSDNPPSIKEQTANGKAPDSSSAVFIPTLANEVHQQLFKQLQRLNADDLKGDDLKREVERSNAVTSLSQAMINNAALVLKAHDNITSRVSGPTMPAMITRQKYSKI